MTRLPLALMGAGIACSVACGMPVSAQSAGKLCGQRQTLMADLKDRYSETPTAIGLDSNGVLVEVLTAKEGETWTILLSMPNGMSCVVASGENWVSRETQARAWQDH